MTPQFGFVRLSDAFTTGSSIMPQKRNPDAAELVRGKAGRIFGALQALLVVMKGLPLAYSKDMQEDKEGAFDAVHALSLCIAAITGMARDLEPDTKAMKRWAGAGYSTATDLADWLVRALNLPFRDAHHVTGRLVGLAAERKIGLEKLVARGHARRRAAHHGGCVRRSRRRAIRPQPHELRRHRPGERAEAGEALARAPAQGAAGTAAAGGARDAGGSDAGRPRPRGLASVNLSRYGAGRVSRFSMIPTVSASGRLALLAGIIVVSLAACGRRGPLEAPPDPAAAAAQRQREEVRRQRQGAAPTANPTGAATAGLTEVPAVAQARRPEGTTPVPGEDDEPDELPSNIVPSPVPTPQSGGRKRGVTIPKEPFILDPLL